MAKIDEPQIIVGLEIGTSKVIAVVGELLPDGVVNVIGVGSCPSKGIDKGSITDLEAVVNSIRRAIEAAESVADLKLIARVTLAITGEHIQSLNESGFVALSGEVTQSDIDDAMHIASSVKVGDGLTLLHAIPQEYSVDQQTNIKNPLGLQGVRLTAQAHLIACHQDWLINLRKAVERSGLKVDEIVFSGLASSYSVLSEEEKELGVCLIDIGAGTMDILVFTDGSLRYSKVIPYAGNRVTDDVAQGIFTSRTNAENIKVNYGSAVLLSNPEKRNSAERVIEVPGIGGRPSRVLTKESLSIITSARYKELLTLVDKELHQLKRQLKEKNVSSELIAGIVLTGGGSLIDGMLECATEVFGQQVQVKIGTPLNITGLTDYVDKPQYATVLGLLQYTYHQSSGVQPQIKGMTGELSKTNKIGSLFKKFLDKVKSEF
ncbi:cell division protein FtsA [Gallibacterium salpingitidis]|uniref:Cell division protein FtsA n=1 Tax=Gallibacterium salpingitidis TaxID=505341 RepID=A0A1A7NMI6_9PAST|nr:cell division protein FtsA [Gallibacterium salpingitidis]OBW91342.1 cell division protein FtsA [Gallibacterium salpingitidis]OBX09025.1 cell division protein FtsA [Gallibacterium salpingitidis]OBX10145.1 cell division protein FtsA [Gallibacterium salpingitidis]WKS98679.1 cell division protein FtsA [Gallibacterium salpingitidis]